MQLPAFLVEWPYGEIMLRGHRIGLYSVIRYHREGLTPEQLHEQFPTLSQELIGQVLEFYRQHQPEVDDYVDRCAAELARQEALYQPRVSHDELRRRLEEKKRSQKG